MKRERYGDARAPLEKAAASPATARRAHYQLSLLFARLGDDAASRRHLELYQQALRENEARLAALRRPAGTAPGDVRK
jgi:hypothetical protein